MSLNVMIVACHDVEEHPAGIVAEVKAAIT
jgi:hypothetical protein